MNKKLPFLMACICFAVCTFAYGASTNNTTSSIRPSQCGSTLPAINTLIAAVCTPQATIYRFEVTNTRSGSIQTIDRPVHYFSLTMLPSYDYATTYSIRIQLQVNGIWQGIFGPECSVSSPSILAPDGAAQIVGSQCNTYLENINKPIATVSLAAVTGYRFKITNLADTDPETQIQVIDRQYNWFSLTMLHKYNYGARYTVEVAVKTTGTYSDYGSPCIVGAPEVPILAACGTSVTDASTPIFTESLSRVNSYRFEVTDLTSLVSTTIDRNVNWFTFSHIPGYNAESSYGVRIALLTNGSYSEYGDACEIFPPQNSRMIDLQQADSISELNVQAFPNPFNESFQISSNFRSDGEIEIKSYDMTGRLLENVKIISGELASLELGKTYPTGLYSIVVQSGAEIRTLRVIKR